MIRAVDPLVSLPATDVARAVDFYTRTLGLETVLAAPESDFHIFRAPGDGPMLGVHRHEGAVARPEEQGIWLWLKVDEIAPVRRRLEAAGVRFLGETRPLGPGFELPFLDSEGNVVRLYELLREVRRSVEIAAPPAAVFRALTDARRIERWFAAIDDVELDARVGGRIAFRDPQFGTVEGRVTALDAPVRVAFEFTANWPTHLEFTLTALPKGATRVAVWQHGFDAIHDRDFGIPGLVHALDAALAALGTEVGAAVMA